MRSRPGHGPVTLGPFSSFRKLKRAFRRGLRPPEYLRAMKNAGSEKALMRHPWYRKRKVAAVQGGS